MLFLLHRNIYFCFIALITSNTYLQTSVKVKVKYNSLLATLFLSFKMKMLMLTNWKKKKFTYKTTISI